MRIHKLNNLVAQRIAAGEVIERPSSVVRELIDNSIDSGATSITLRLKNGGLDEITLIDNGSGINKEDLKICTLSHTTSKVNSIEDLYHLATLGFRGEALYSIAAISKLTISSSYESGQAYKIVVDNGEIFDVIKGGPEKGTVISVEDLFAEIPARREFLKRPSTEALMCKNILVEKSLAFENIEFRYYNNDKLITLMPKATRQVRILEALATRKFKIQTSDSLILTTKQERFSIYAVAAKPYIHRSDRSHIKIYINGRPIDNYALMQAVTMGYGELLPGGSFPYCYIFLTIDPTLIDINIHPAKKEAKIRIQSEIHHSIVMMIKNQMIRDIPQFTDDGIQEDLPLENFTNNDETKEPDTVKSNWDLAKNNTEQNNEYNNSTSKYEIGKKTTSYFNHRTNSASSIVNDQLRTDKPNTPNWFETAKRVLKDQDNKTQEELYRNQLESTDQKNENKESLSKIDFTETNIDSTHDWKYLGQAFNLYLIVEKDKELFLIDQHAAHERIQYNKIKKRQGIQKLLIPISFEVERDVDDYLLSNNALYLTMGIELKRIDQMLWEIHSLPTVYKNIEGKIINYITHNTGDLIKIETGLFAIIACHSAIKQGDKIDDKLAEQIIEEVFKMDEPCCPHGRTFLIRFEKSELDKAVGRTV
jgi:DNA mismatch repair protein MutL